MKKKLITYSIEVISSEGYVEEFRCVSNFGCKKVGSGYAN